MEELKQILLSITGIDKYQRVGLPHPLAWYIGRDSCARYSLFCITETEPKTVSSSRMISVYVGHRKAGNYGITFSLQDNNYLDLFLHFCDDMIDFTKRVGALDAAADRICGRFIQWQKAFKKNNGELLSFEEVKGLLGELCFLKMKMIPKYGVDVALKSWSGTEHTDQDFSCDDTWYEVKSTVSGSSSVKISSVEQLDTNQTGHLVIVTLDKTSEADASRLTLNSMYEMVLSSIPTLVLQESFKNRMLAYGYYINKAYDRLGFRYNGMSMYRVDSRFPCLRKAEIPLSVQNAKYELSLPAIDEFKED